MKQPKLFLIGIVLFLAAALLFNSFFIIDQTEQALVLRFGKPVNIETDPGLKMKAPFVDTVVYFDKRTIILDSKPKTVILEDQDRLIVDAFVTYRITDPLRFYQAVRDERTMNMRLESILEKSLRDSLGRENLGTLLSSKRTEIMRAIRENVYRLASGEAELQPGDAKRVEGEANERDVKGFGIKVVDVRIMRTDLPKETSDPIYNRMRSDRQKVAERFRAEGQRESQIIRSEADKTRTIMLAEAQKESEIIRGQGDGEATRIFAEAFGQDEDFFEFYRAMQAYRNSLKKEDTTLVISPEDGFLRYFEKR